MSRFCVISRIVKHESDVRQGQRQYSAVHWVGMPLDFVRANAGDLVADVLHASHPHDRFESRYRRAAVIDHKGTSRVKRASGWRGHGTRCFTLHRDAIPVCPRIRVGNGLEERPRVGVGRVLENPIDWPFLDDTT